MRALVTGGTGFVGRALIKKLNKDEVDVSLVTRRREYLDGTKNVTLLDALDENVNWSIPLAGCDVVVHLAARVHIMKDTSINPTLEFRAQNVDATLNLARQAASAGVRRFVFVSSVKVHGEGTNSGFPYRANDPAAPVDAYGISKFEAEVELRELAARTGMELVIVRPVLVYGAGVKANFLSLIRLVEKGLPLPFGLITENRRSFVAVENLVDLIGVCMKHPLAANEAFLASDGEDLSTAELTIRLGRALGRPTRLFNVPVKWLERGGGLLGKSNMVQRLCGSLQVDISESREILDWRPPFTIEEGFRMTVEKRCS